MCHEHSRPRPAGVVNQVLKRYERITFDKDRIAPQGQPKAAFVSPGHQLLDATIGLVLEQNADLLRQGTVLVDEQDTGTDPRVMFYLEHAIQDARQTEFGDHQQISRRMLYVEVRADGDMQQVHYAPYLDYRPLGVDEPGVDELLARPECGWIVRDLERQVTIYAVAHIVPEHHQEVKTRRLGWIKKARVAVRDRLTKEINHWDHRAESLKLDELVGKPNARINSREAQRRAEDLASRLQKRMESLQQEEDIASLPPVVRGGFLVVPAGLLAAMTQAPAAAPALLPGGDKQAVAARAREVVMQVERDLGYQPVDKELERLGYDIESSDPAGGPLRFIEVKGRAAEAETITVTKNEVLYSLNKPQQYILAIVLFGDDGEHQLHYVRQPFQREPDFSATSVNYNLKDLLAMAEVPV